MDMKYLILFYIVMEWLGTISGSPPETPQGSLRISLSFLRARWSVDRYCQVVCIATPLFLFECRQIVTLGEYCEFMNNQESFGCCSEFATSVTSTSTPSTSTTPTSSTTSSTTWLPSSTPSSTTWFPSWTSPTPQTTWTTRTVQPSWTNPSTPLNIRKPWTTSKSFTFSTPGFYTWTMAHSTPHSTSTSSPWLTTPTLNTETSISEEMIDCSYFTNNPCGCRLQKNSKCDYNVLTGKCQLRHKECDYQFFQGNQCGRLNAFYIQAGLICKNTISRGNCVVEKNIFSVNCNGAAVSENGISYQGDSSKLYYDIQNIRESVRESSIWNHDDAVELYTTMIKLASHEDSTTGCISYAVIITKPGRYELALSFTEPVANGTGERLFNIKLHDTVVLQEFDIFAVAGRLNPLKVYFNFDVTPTFGDELEMTINGHRPKIVKGPVRLALCHGECSLCPNSSADISIGLLSGFSFLRLDG